MTKAGLISLATALVLAAGLVSCKKKQPAPAPMSAQAAPAETVGAAGLAPLMLQLPKPLFVGTPTDIPVPNLEKPLGKARPPLLVPAGATTNLALRRPVSSSDPYPIIGELSLATDGDKEGTDGSWVELGWGRQYVQIDLGQPHVLFAIVVWHYHRQARAYHDVVVQVSDDPDFVTGVTTVFNNDYDNSSGLGLGQDRPYVETAEGKLIPLKGVRARYVRLYSKGNTSDGQNHYTEVEVYGK